MELLAIVLVWPLILLVLGVAFIAVYTLNGGFFFLSFILFLIILVIARQQSRSEDVGKLTPLEQIEYARRAIVTFSIALLLPILMRYLVDMSDNSLPIVIIGLIIGFGLAIWGMFIKDNKVLTYSNIIGGALIIVYIYIQLWELGELPRIIAAAFGLLMAVIVSVIKLKEKLT